MRSPWAASPGASMPWAPAGGVAQQGEGMPGTTKQDHQAERLQAIRLRYTINTHLEDQGVVTPAAIGAATGLHASEAVRLLTRRQWREGDVAALKAIADRLGLEVPLEGLRLPMQEGRGPCPRSPSPRPPCRTDRQRGQAHPVPDAQLHRHRRAQPALDRGGAADPAKARCARRHQALAKLARFSPYRCAVVSLGQHALPARAALP